MVAICPYDAQLLASAYYGAVVRRRDPAGNWDRMVDDENGRRQPGRW